MDVVHGLQIVFEFDCRYATLRSPALMNIAFMAVPLSVVHGQDFVHDSLGGLRRGDVPAAVIADVGLGLAPFANPELADAPVLDA